MLAVAETTKIGPAYPIWRIIFAIGKQRWALESGRSDEMPPAAEKVFDAIFGGQLQGVTTFYVI